MHKGWLLYFFLGGLHILGFLVCMEGLCSATFLPFSFLHKGISIYFGKKKKNKLTWNSCRNKDLREEGRLLWCWTSPLGEKCGFLSEEGLGFISSSLSLCFVKSQGRWGRHICILEISLVFIWLVLSVNISFVLPSSIWPSDFLNFEWDSGVRRHTGEPLWLKLGLRKPPPQPCTPLPRDQHGSRGRNQSERALDTSLTIFLPGSSFCIWFCSPVFL